MDIAGNSTKQVLKIQLIHHGGKKLLPPPPAPPLLLRSVLILYMVCGTAP
jgi:hypothetical protein